MTLLFRRFAPNFFKIFPISEIRKILCRAIVGQIFTQAQQRKQSFESIFKVSDEIAFTGHNTTQDLQCMHF